MEIDTIKRRGRIAAITALDWLADLPVRVYVATGGGFVAGYLLHGCVA